MSYSDNYEGFPAQIEDIVQINESKYTWCETEAHSYLKVPFNDIIDLKIEDQISSYSYKSGDSVYLEADGDAYTFMNAVKAKGQTFVSKSVILDDLSFLAGATKFGEKKKHTIG